MQNRRVILIGAVLASIAGFSERAAADSDMWNWVNEVVSKPIEKNRLEDLSNSRLEITEDNWISLRHEGKGPIFSDGTRIDKISLIYSKNRSADRTEIYALVSGRCIKIQEIEDIFGNADLMSLPTHGYPDAAATYRSRVENGKITFHVNFHTRCLLSLLITPSEHTR